MLRPLLRSFVALLVLACAPLPAYAEAMLLIHGYLGAGSEWRGSGMTRELEQGGWHDGGHLRATGEFVDTDGLRPRRGPQSFYTVDLPSESNLTTQTIRLEATLARVRARHPDESLVLVGFSAGGVVARLYMVRNPTAPVRALITIASPHLGTDSAEIALLASRSPLADYAPLVGADTLLRSRALYADLLPERPDTFLYRLNRQPHPEAAYIAVVRENHVTEPGDLVVPADSQDMNKVFSLRGRVRTLRVPGLHGVQASDAELVLRVLRESNDL